MSLPHIRYTVPFDYEKNLARAFNDEMDRTYYDEYVCFKDRDVWFPHPFHQRYIAEIVADHPNAAFTCLTGRTNNRWQKWLNSGEIDTMEGQAYEAKRVWDLYEHACHDHTKDQLWSGHVMIVPKSLWIPLDEEEGGLLGIDNKIHEMIKEQGGRILLMAGVWVAHYYSGWTGENGHAFRDKSHLK